MRERALTFLEMGIATQKVHKISVLIREMSQSVLNGNERWNTSAKESQSYMVGLSVSSD